MAIPLNKKSGISASDFYSGSSASAMASGERAGAEIERQGREQRARWRQQLELEKESAAAQTKANDLLEQRIADKFVVSSDSAQYNGINNIWDETSNELIDVYSNIVNNKDMANREKILNTQKLLRQVPMMSSAKNILNERMAQYSALSVQGGVSNAMKGKYQRMYADLMAGDFEGGIVVEGDKMILRGKTKSSKFAPEGDEINLPLQDFEAHLPEIIETAGTLTENLAGLTSAWRKDQVNYRQSGLAKDKPTWNKESVISAQKERIAQLGEHGDKMFATDIMKIDPPVYDQMVQSKVGKNDPLGIVTQKQYNKLMGDEKAIEANAELQYPNDPDAVVKYKEKLKAIFEQKPDVLSLADARKMVTKDLLQDYALAAKAQFDLMGFADTIPSRGPLTNKQLATLEFNSDLERQTTNWIGGIRDRESETILDGIKNAANAQIVLKEGKPVLLYDKIEKTALVDEGGEKILKEFPRSIEVDLNDEDAIERIWKSKFMVGTAAQKDRAAKWWNRNRLKAIKSMKEMFEAEALKRNEDRSINAYQNARIFGGGPNLSPEERKKVLAKYKF